MNVLSGNLTITNDLPAGYNKTYTINGYDDLGKFYVQCDGSSVENNLYSFDEALNAVRDYVNTDIEIYDQAIKWEAEQTEIENRHTND